jgi:hypothetical protein
LSSNFTEQCACFIKCVVQLNAVKGEPLRFILGRAFTDAAHVHAAAAPVTIYAFCLIHAYGAQIGLVWIELLRLGDGGKRVKLGVDVTLDLAELVPTLQPKNSQCV